MRVVYEWHSLTIFGSNLSSGAYTYTLVADGVVVASKKC